MYDHIELEDEITIKAWFEEFCRPENIERITLPNCPYSLYEIQREILRRERLKDK